MNNFYFYLSKILGPLINPTNFLFIILFILFILFLILKKKNIILKFLVINIFTIFLISFFPLGNIGLQFLENEFRNKIEYKNIENIENIVVLSGDNKRILASIKLASKIKNSKIFFIGGSSFLIQDITKKEVLNAMDIYKDVNFDITRVTFHGKSRNTIENFQEIKKLNLDVSKTLLITSAFHMRRSILISKKFNLNFILYPVDFRSRAGGNLINNYQGFNIASNLSDFNIFFREIIGIAAFKIFY